MISESASHIISVLRGTRAISGRRRDHLANSRHFGTGLKMKQIDIPYGRGAVSVCADPKLAQWDVIRPSFEPALEDSKRLFHKAVRHPLGTKPLREIVKPSDRVVIATSDGTRPVPNKQLIPWLEVRACKLQVIPDLNKAIHEHLESRDNRVAVLPDGPLVIPYL